MRRLALPLLIVGLLVLAVLWFFKDLRKEGESISTRMDFQHRELPEAEWWRLKVLMEDTTAYSSVSVYTNPTDTFFLSHTLDRALVITIPINASIGFVDFFHAMTPEANDQPRYGSNAFLPDGGLFNYQQCRSRCTTLGLFLPNAEVDVSQVGDEAVGQYTDSILQLRLGEVPFMTFSFSSTPVVAFRVKRNVRRCVAKFTVHFV